jgi:signal transduction histidine kinase
VYISVEIIQRQFQLRVLDNGIGFDESSERPGNGLKNLRRRAVELGGAIELQSRPGEGTTVTLHAHIT